MTYKSNWDFLDNLNIQQNLANLKVKRKNIFKRFLELFKTKTTNTSHNSGLVWYVAFKDKMFASAFQATDFGDFQLKNSNAPFELVLFDFVRLANDDDLERLNEGLAPRYEYTK